MYEKAHATVRRGFRILLASAILTGLAIAAPAHAATPFQTPVEFTIGSGQSSQCLALSVPSGTQLTITFASVLTQASTTGQQVTGVFVYTKLSGQSTDAYNVVPVTALTAISYQGAQTMTAFADYGISNNPRLCVTRSTTSGTMEVYGAVNGYTQ